MAVILILGIIFLTTGHDVSAVDDGPVSEPEPLPPEMEIEPPRILEPVVSSDPEDMEETPNISFPLGFTGFSYNGSVPEGAAVENDWFSDAVFLGDSRTDGFRLHSGLTNSHIYGEKCISVFNVFTEDTVRLDDGSFGTLLDALAIRQYKKVYIMLGVNELGYGPEEYRAKYEELTDQVQLLQPEADIYIQALIPVTQSKSSADRTYNNGNIQAFNQQLADLCEQKGFYYVDTYSAFADENGALPEELSWDGVNLTASGCTTWLDYLKKHTITEN